MHLPGGAWMSAQMESSRLFTPRGMFLIRGLGHFAFKSTRIEDRFALPDRDQLHRKIFEMGQRIRQLEDVFAILQSNVSMEPHTLLADQVLTTNPKLRLGYNKFEAGLTEVLNGFGTLTIRKSGEARYLGSAQARRFVILCRVISQQIDLTYWL